MCSGAKVNEQELTYIVPNVHTVCTGVLCFFGVAVQSPSLRKFKLCNFGENVSVTAQVTDGYVEDFMSDKINCIFFFLDICNRGLFVMSIIKVTMVMNLK